jgi:ABC-type branched-subunit amino acid transport system substrate-binding protein
MIKLFKGFTLSILAILITAIGIHVAAQERFQFNAEAESTFLLGIKQYTDRNYQSSYLSFVRVQEDYPPNQRLTAAAIMMAKSLLRLRQFKEAAAVGDHFVETYPQSRYLEDAYFTAGVAYYRQYRYVEALRRFVAVLRYGTDPKIVDWSRRATDDITMVRLGLQELNDLVDQSRDEEMKKVLYIVRGEKFYSSGNMVEAADNARKAATISASPSLDHRVKKLLELAEEGKNITVGVMLPLMQQTDQPSPTGRLAGEILEGIKFAVDDFYGQGANKSQTVTLNIRDTQRDTTFVVRLMEEFAADKHCVAVVGPLFSNELAAAAKVAEEKEIPVISPTATENNIASSGKYVFQANPDYVTRAKAMAQYAVLTMGCKNLAVIGPNADPGKSMMEAFAREVRQLGGTIVSDKRYVRGATDLRHVFRAMRSDAADLDAVYSFAMAGKFLPQGVFAILKRAGVQQAILDTLGQSGFKIQVEEILGPSAKLIADSLKIPLVKTTIALDSLELPVTQIQAIYCPIASSAEIGIVTSLLVYYNIKTVVLGSDEWNDPNELELNKRYADGVIFSADRWIDNSGEYSQFVSRFNRMYSKQPNDNTLFGYDAAMTLLIAIKEGGFTRPKLTENLSRVSDRQALHSKISFTENHVNAHLHILQYKKGKISKIGEARYRKNALPQ